MAGRVSKVELHHANDPAATRVIDRFTPDFIKPAPRLFVPPKECPKAVELELDRAFAAFWFDASACANSIRSVVELIMTNQKVPRFARTKRGRRRLLSLHERITTWRDERGGDKSLANRFLALKWIGNPASHAGPDAVDRDDLFDAFDLLSDAMTTLMADDEHKRGLDHLARVINKRKKPRSQHKR
jgi:hypothetical protein